MMCPFLLECVLLYMNTDSQNLINVVLMQGTVTQKVDPPYLVPPGPNISKYLDPRIIYFKLAEIFGPPGTKISELFGPL